MTDTPSKPQEAPQPALPAFDDRRVREVAAQVLRERREVFRQLKDK